MSEETAAAAGRPPPGPTIFDKILDGTIPADFIHKDEHCVAFNDVSPQVRTTTIMSPDQSRSVLVTQGMGITVVNGVARDPF